MVSEEEDAEQRKLHGITIGNPEALAIMIDISAAEGTDRDWLRWDANGAQPSRVHVMSLDMLFPLVDGERGARARLTQIVAAAKKHDRCGDADWHWVGR